MAEPLQASATTASTIHALYLSKPRAKSKPIWFKIPLADLAEAWPTQIFHQEVISAAIRGAVTVTKIGTWRTLERAI
jgi:hypothetical protein